MGTARYHRFGLAALALLATACGGTRPSDEPVPSAHAERRLACTAAEGPSRLQFRNGFWLNLHNFLYLQAKRAQGIHDESEGAFPEVDAGDLALRTLTADERNAWDDAVQGYVAHALTHSGRSNPVLDVNERIAAATGDLLPTAVPAELRDALERAAPVYRAIWWPRHQAHNAGWIEAMGALLQLYEGCLGPRLAEALGAEWGGEPIPVDASVYASWYGAYSTAEPPHITMATTAVGNRGAMGLEGLLHEAGHVTPQRLGPALTSAAEAQGRTLAPELAHLLLFYTAGDLVWRALPGHPGYARTYGIWDQNDRARAFRTLLAREWRPWLDGERTFRDAVAAVVAGTPALQAPETPPR